MLATLTLLCALTQGNGLTVNSIFQQAAPKAGAEPWTRSPQQFRAVVLIHGYRYHFLDRDVPKADLRPWQRGDSALVKELASISDVYAFGYGQNASIAALVEKSKLRESITQLRKLGYKEIVLLGHSAGGLIARQLVEDHPDVGVTKVIQVCTPNGGSPLATFRGPKSQQVFLDCLTEKGRKECLTLRADKQIPATVQFVCVVGTGDGKSGGDGVVPCPCQWTPDLQKQGIPAIALLGSHRDVVREPKAAAILVRLITQTSPRWTAEQVEKARKELFGE